MSHIKEAVLVGYDNLMREFIVESCEGEFMEFGVNQEYCRNQWLTCERELERMRRQIAEAEHLKAKLEAQNHHVHGLLQGEIRKRIKEQQAKKEVEEKFELIRQTLCDEDRISVDASEMLKPLLVQSRRKSSGIERLETIDEVTSASSSASFEKSDEELELSGLVRSYREMRRNSGHSVNSLEANVEMLEPPIDYDELPLPESDEHEVAKPTMVWSSHGPVKASSAFNTGRGIEQQQEAKADRPHSFKKLTILHSVNCLPCGQRIRFGRAALKCVDCGEVCHLDCERKMPNCSNTKKKKTVTFFSSPKNSGNH